MTESKTERFKIAHDIIEKMTDEELAISLIRAGLLRQYEMQINDLSDELAAANAELAAAVKKVEDFDLVVVMNKKICSELDAAKARVAAYKKALDIAMSTNQSHETYCKVEAALEEKPSENTKRD